MLPDRKKLPHEIPPWVPDRSRYFITINCAERGGNLLANDRVALPLLDSIRIYESMENWFVFVMVVMPDHLHMIAAFQASNLRKVCKAWKSYHAKHLKIGWQGDFFEHRIRNDAEFVEKLHYILNNPVRKGLVSCWRDWPYTFVRGDWGNDSGAQPESL